MRVKNCLGGPDISIPDEFAVSNEVWSDETLACFLGVSGDAAVVVGSGNAPNILPLIEGLERVSFVDIAPGHGEVYRAKLHAAMSNGTWGHNLGPAFTGALVSEAGLFDLLRSPSEERHFTTSLKARESFAELNGTVEVKDKMLNILDDSRASSVNDGAERLGWVHLSNVVPYCVEREAKDVERKLFGFIDDLPGVDDDTVVTFSRRGDVLAGDLTIRRLVVMAKRLDDIVFSDLLNDDSIRFDGHGGVVRRVIA